MLFHKCRLILQSAQVEESLTIWVERKSCWSPAPAESSDLHQQWCAETKQVCCMGDARRFAEALNSHIPASIRYPHWTLRIMQPVKWECNPRALCDSSFSSNFRIGPLSWNLYSDAHTHMQKLNQTANVFSSHLPFSWARISGRLWINIMKLFSLTVLKSPFLPLELIQSKDLRSIVPQAQGTTRTCRRTGHYSWLHPVITCNWQLTTSTRHSEFTESGRQKNSNYFFICFRLGSFMQPVTRAIDAQQLVICEGMCFSQKL